MLLGGKWDVLYLNSTVCGRLLPALRGAKTVLHVHDMVTRVPRHWAGADLVLAGLEGGRGAPRPARRPRRALPHRPRPAARAAPLAGRGRARGRLRRADRAAQGRHGPRDGRARDPRAGAGRPDRRRRRRPLRVRSRLPRRGPGLPGRRARPLGRERRGAHAPLRRRSPSPRGRSRSGWSPRRPWRSGCRSSPRASTGWSRWCRTASRACWCAPGDPAALADGIVRVLERRAELGPAAARAARRFDADDYADRVEALLRRLL